MKNKKITSCAFFGFFLVVAFGLFISCEIQDKFSYEKSNSGNPLGITAWEYIQKSDSLVLLEEAIKLTNTQDLYDKSVGKTFIAPTNNAFKDYLRSNSYQDLSEIPLPILRNVIKYLIVNAYVSFDDPNISVRNNPIPYQSSNGQTMFLSRSSNYTGLINEGTNRQWEIVTSNLKSTTGVIHVVSAIVFFSAKSTATAGPDPEVVRDTIFPIADTYINGGSSAARNFGTTTTLRVKNVTGRGAYDRKTYLMYDLKDFKKEGVVVDFKLELAVSFTAAKAIEIYVHNVADTLWTEQGLTFNNATAPTTPPVSTIISSKVSTFEFDMLDYYKGLNNKGRISLMIDQKAGRDETDDFHSKENTRGFFAPMLIARLSSGNVQLILERNSGFTVASGETFVFNNTVLQVTGAPVGDMRFKIVEAPKNGWLIRGANILKVGDTFTQEDVDFMNLVYISNGSGSQDSIVVSGADRSGATLNSFNIPVTIQ